MAASPVSLSKVGGMGMSIRPSMPIMLPFASSSSLPVHQQQQNTSPTSCSALRLRTTIQKRHATLIKRPRRPYAFTQLLALSDGSTFLHRTTSPLPVYRSGRDTRNAPLWNPSNDALVNVEEDEAGRLRAFRRRFGRGWDAEAAPSALGEGREVKLDADGNPTIGEVGEMDAEEQLGRRKEGHQVKSDSAWSAEHEDNLMDLIGSFAPGGSNQQQQQQQQQQGQQGQQRARDGEEGIAMQTRQDLSGGKMLKNSPRADRKKK